MRPWDPHWQTFSGEAITNITPAGMRVYGPPLTAQQASYAGMTFALFCSRARLSVVPNIQEHGRLADGTPWQIAAIHNSVYMTVFTAKEDEQRLPHGFVVVAGWSVPTFYGRSKKAEGEWSFRIGQDVPQAKDGIQAYNRRTHTAFMGPKKATVLPSVLATGDALWDWARHAPPQSPDSNAVPLALQVNGPGGASYGKKDVHATHYAYDGKITRILNPPPALGPALQVMYQSEVTTPILVVDPEDPTWMPTASDSEGNGAALQHWRRAVISPSANLWLFKFANDSVYRSAPNGYSTPSGGRNETSFITPLAEVTDGDPEDVVLLGEDPNYLLQTASMGFERGIAFDVDPPGVETFVFGHVRTGAKDYQVDLAKQPVGGVAITEKLTQTNGVPQLVEKVIALGGPNSIEFVRIVNSLQYKRDVYWRAGEVSVGFDRNVVYGPDWPFNYHGVHQCKIKRKDLKYHMDGMPKLEVDVGWKKVAILDGTTTGRMDGRRYDDIKTTHFSDETWSNSYGATLWNWWVTRADDFPGSGPGGVAWCQANDVLRTEIAQWAEEFGPIPGGVKEVVVADDEPTNSASYTLKSRHIIDYDHGGRFCAAIRVEVECKKASWKHDPAFYLGHMVVDKHPEYTVKIYFESDWNGTKAERLLVEESCTRPMFEAQTLTKINPYYWPLPIEMERPVLVRMPPVVRPDQDFAFQLPTLANHQGVNTRMVMHDFNKDMPPEMASDENVQFSTIRRGEEISHTARSMGMLYARTFTLNEVSEALWLLRHTHCDAEEGGFTPPLEDPPRPKWFYMPGILAALSKKIHIELRDGALTQWSDSIPGALDPETGKPKPAPTDPADREIRLYLV